MWKTLAILLSAATALAGPITVPHERYVLPNGLEVIIAPDNRVPLVAVNLWYHVGSGDETPGKSGFAHLFEHMLFQGSKHVGSDRHFSVLKDVGATEINGTTNSDRTNYFELVPANALESVLWLESDRMGYLLDMVTETSFRNQVDVVRNERRQRYDNVAGGRSSLALAEAMFPEGHPYRYTTIGRHEDLERASLADVTGFYREWYAPSNATLAIVGAVKPEEARALVEKWFGSFRALPKPSHRVVATPANKAKTVTIEDPLLTLPMVWWAWHSPALYAAGDAELDIVADALTREGTGRLYQALVTPGLATSVSVSQSSQQRSSVFSIRAVLRPTSDRANVERVVAAELARLQAEGLTEAERQRAIVSVEASLIRRAETLMGRAELLQSMNHYLGHTDLSKWTERYQATTLAGIKAEAARLDPTQATVLVTAPGNKGSAK